MRNFLNDDSDVGGNVGLSVLTVVDFELEDVPALGDAVLHGDDAGVLLQVKVAVRWSSRTPAECLVRKIPVVAIVDIDTTNRA